MTREWVEAAMVKAGHAINANGGRCGLIEDALCQETTALCALLDLQEERDALRAACESARSLLARLGGHNHDPEYSELVAAIALVEAR